jgi:uncharacterized protein YndB with AHSA1/START domain
MSNEKEREIVNIRAFNVPREVLFNAWADPEQLVQWWGPKGFRNTFHEFDFRAGTIWRYTMHGPDGIDYQNKSVFKEIVKPERIVFQHLKPMHRFMLTAIFEDLGDQTKLTFRQLFETVEECDRVRGFIIDANEQNLDRLEALVSKNLIKK